MKNVSYKNREITDERLALVDKEGNYYLGPELTLRRCTLVLRVAARWLNILPTRFIECTIEVKQELKNFAWTGAALKGCRFTGRMTGCVFGPWRNYAPNWEFGSVEDCDFSEARLNNCRFLGCDMRTLRLPRWPCFTIVDPIKRSQALNSVKWPGRIGQVVMEGLYDEPASSVARTFFAPAMAERYGTTEEELKAVVEQFDFIVH